MLTSHLVSLRNWRQPRGVAKIERFALARLSGSTGNIGLVEGNGHVIVSFSVVMGK